MILDAYLGTFSSKQLPFKIIFTDEAGVLNGEAVGQGKFPLENIGVDKFRIPNAPIEVLFNETKTEMTFAQGDKKFVFTRD